MTDLYLRATSYAALQSHMASAGLTLAGNYYQDENCVVDWIGKVPKTYATDPETGESTGEVLEYFTGYRFNVRLLNPDCTLFDNFTNLHPETPYRVFA